MKKILIVLGAFALGTLTTNATLVLSNSFAYTDGTLTAVSAGSPLGVWTAHSSGNGPIQVSSEKITIVTGSSSFQEDVNTVITNATFPVHFSNQVLYASFNATFSVMPSGSGTYFAHFKDDTSSNFRCRIFSTTTGAGPGKFRLGVANGSSDGPFVIATDLDLSTTYKVVVRFSGSTNSTIWIAPTSESSVVNRADATVLPSNSYKGSQSFAFRQSPNTGTITIDDLLIGTTFADVQTIGGPPSISGLVNVSIPANTDTGNMPFTVGDFEDPTGTSLTVAAISDNPTLVPNSPANLTFGGSGNNRTLKVTPAASQQGIANIEVVVTDTNLPTAFTATNNFTVTVGLPSISALANRDVVTNTPAGPFAFTVNDNETAPGSLTVNAYSSDQAVLPDANIAIDNLGGQNRAISFTNIAAGTSVVAVVVNDGTFNVTNSFTLTAYPLLGLVLGDDFDYADGLIEPNSGTFWARHSGSANDAFVVVNRLQLTNSGSDDVNALLTNAVYAANGGFVFYSRFIVNFTGLPTASGSGEYFAHYKDTGTANFRARVSAITTGAAAGNYRLAIARGGFTQGVFPADLLTNKPHVVITRYNVGTGESQLWVDPTSESSTSATAPADTSFPVPIAAYAFRQSSGIGTMTVDGLRIGTSFNDVFTNIVPASEPLQIAVLGNNAVLTWTNALHTLQAAPLVAGTYTNVAGATSPFTNAATGAQKYFRLKY